MDPNNLKPSTLGPKFDFKLRADPKLRNPRPEKPPDSKLFTPGRKPKARKLPRIRKYKREHAGTFLGGSPHPAASAVAAWPAAACFAAAARAAALPAALPAVV